MQAFCDDRGKDAVAGEGIPATWPSAGVPLPSFLLLPSYHHHVASAGLWVAQGDHSSHHALITVPCSPRSCSNCCGTQTALQAFTLPPHEAADVGLMKVVCKPEPAATSQGQADRNAQGSETRQPPSPFQLESTQQDNVCSFLLLVNHQAFECYLVAS